MKPMNGQRLYTIVNWGSWGLATVLGTILVLVGSVWAWVPNTVQAVFMFGSVTGSSITWRMSRENREELREAKVVAETAAKGRAE